ncbi:type VI secretion system tip protein TssI/VgrG [Paracidovorax citrulli]|uniref:Rhs element Vgr protein n=2 Tax=Paracidovorax citrulli TaxID=80869 RepID=A1TSG7_PARC0|nr:type VI secretion system tip protein TssI/VgrG [Paracidovorax citrulli]ABM33905.1 Rhs element Vgr protein [Paracidovorax citrulli AAC00-1]ATG94472.1 type VI secretion system tip protein VgrG [Paracidovorax citrulli]MVT28415.1 type VI secretion system tip protein VgrG [Paracidovorax citrulli]MVT38728.1 type VI secretion system tip protein VgrG [Paracidovorax citrulli]PVY63341.1 type VI secretion system secreted protein VgrG [Paracidovorax citrulli]
MTRRVTIQTPLGEQLQFRQLQGREELSQVFSLDIDLLSEDKSIDPKALLGKSATVVVETEGGGRRYLDGIVTRFGMQGQDHRFYAYRLRLQPWVWLASRKSDFRIFQNKSVPQIIEEVLGAYGYPMEKKLSRSYRTWEYCVQYDESDLQFVSRLMEHEGIYYYHQHAQGQHTLTLADDIVASHQPLPGAATIPFYPPEKSAVADRENIHAWELHEEIHSGRFYNDDYDFKKPKADLANMRQMPPGHSHDAYETYEWPGGYTEFGDGEAYARVRLQENLSGRSTVRGESRHRSLATGYLFTLENYPRADQNQQYLITGLQYHFKENPRVSAANPGQKGTVQEEGSFQRFTLQAQPTSLPYTPARVTPKPKTTGPQTAVVVGPPGEEIWPDQYGRVKVQFHWDRQGRFDEQSSCWIRVSQGWAGQNYGSIYLPRIGQEVIVDFLSGDPDQPIITGRVYNADQMPPWKLPEHKTQSGTLTRWSKGGGGASMLRFEDQKGIEHLELSNTYGNTYLNMGYLMHQGTGSQRGYGFELRTDLWGSIRADKGLLITTYPQDFTSMAANFNPDGFDQLGAGLAGTASLMQQASQAAQTLDANLGALNSLKTSHMMELGAGIAAMTGAQATSASLSKAAAALSAFQGGGGGAPEAALPSDTDPAMPQSQALRELSRDITQPIVSIVSPQGHTMVSPKPIVISSGQSASMHATQHITVSSGAQLTQLAKAGMLTHVSEGGQRTTVGAGDIATDAQTGNLNLTAEQNATLASRTDTATVVGQQNVNLQATEDSVLVKAGQHIRLQAGATITLTAGEGASITLTSDGKVEIRGKNGLIELKDVLTVLGKPVNIN